MAERLQDKVAIVTGAGSGIGKATATLFAAEGAKLICADVSGKQENVAAAIGGGAVPVFVDVANEADVIAMVALAEKAFGRLDVLVNNAGVNTGGVVPLHEETSQSWERVQSINLKGVFLGMKYGITSMLRTGGGAIVNAASAAALVGLKGLSLYGATKAGVIQMSKAAALDYAGSDIRINVVCPGNTWTSIVFGQDQDPPPPPRGGFVVPGTPMDRWALPAEIAAAILFLASDEASYATGAVLAIDGGYAIGCPGALGATTPQRNS
jgi:NAD(P)-dependent dehydrogenase (short-subunit alcohol dehydrogenase family)